MLICDILQLIAADTYVKIICDKENTGETFIVFEGKAESIPHWVANKKMCLNECISVEGNILLIQTDETRKRGCNNNNNDWLKSLNEEEVLLHLAGLLYQYDSATDHDEHFNDEEWSKVFNVTIDYVESRLGEILANQKIDKWYMQKAVKN